MKNVEYLINSNRKFVMSMKHNNAIHVFKELKNLSNLIDEFAIINSEKFAMMTWHAKSNLFYLFI